MLKQPSCFGREVQKSLALIIHHAKTPRRKVLKRLDLLIDFELGDKTQFSEIKFVTSNFLAALREIL